jgi:hypothetical protein
MATPFYSDVASNALRRVVAARRTTTPVVSHQGQITTDGQDLYTPGTVSRTGAPLAPIGTTAPPPPGTPPAAPGVVDNPTPLPGIDPFLMASATTAYQNALNQVNQGRTSKLNQYGFKATSFDDQGNPIGLGVDPNSLYGSFQQLLQSQAGDAAQAEDNAAGRGLAGSGLGKATEGSMKYGWGAQDVGLGSALTGDLGQLSAQALGAKDTYNNTLYQGQQDAIANALANQDFNPVTDSSYTPTVPWNDNSSTPPDDTTSARPSVKGKTVLWNNQYMNATKLAKTLQASGTSVRTFIQQHPSAAQAIGLKNPPMPKKNGSGKARAT